MPQRAPVNTYEVVDLCKRVTELTEKLIAESRQTVRFGVLQKGTVDHYVRQVQRVLREMKEL